ncbi:MAG: hypothetical protein ACJATT_005564 [Myxococcota bacterium]|jgi:hypothetical protein
MIRTAALALALTATASAASPGYLTLAAAAGYDDQNRALWGGIDLALRPNNRKGFGVIAGVTPAFGGFQDERPMGFAELGLVRYIRAEQATVRLGAVFRTGIVSLPYRTAVTLGETETGEFGLTPALMLHIEFEYGEDAPFVFGIRAGLGTGVSNFRCVDPDDLGNCAVWTETFVASAFGNVRLKNGLFGELMFGHISKLSLGYAF